MIVSPYAIDFPEFADNVSLNLAANPAVYVWVLEASVWKDRLSALAVWYDYSPVAVGPNGVLTNGLLWNHLIVIFSFKIKTLRSLYYFIDERIWKSP